MANASVLRVNDPRNYADKHFLNDSIRTLMKYLVEHNFDYNIPAKNLTRPSNKEFTAIVLFLFRQYDLNYTLTGKFEDEVVAMFKQIGYPCQISRANITAAGTPHAWPYLLAALVWLVDLLEYEEALGPGGFGTSHADPNEQDERAATQSAFYSYLSQAYALFMVGEDDRYAELEEKFVHGFESRNLLIKDEIVALEQRNLMLASEIEHVERRRLQLPELERKKNEFLGDLTKYQTMVDQLDLKRSQWGNKVANRQAESENLVTSIQTTTAEIAELRNTIAKQEISPEDVRRMLADHERIEAQLRDASQLKSVSLEKLRQTQEQMVARLNALGDATREYNRTAEELKLVPVTARNSRGRNLLLEVDLKAQRGQELIKTDVRATLLPPLQAIRREIAEMVQSYKTDLLRERETLDEVTAKVSEMHEQKASIENRLRRAEEAYRQEREALERAEQGMQDEIDRLQAQVMRMQDAGGADSRLTRTIRRVEQLKEARRMQQLDHEKRRNDLMTAVCDVVALCANHRDMAHQKLSMLMNRCGEQLDDCIYGRGSSAALRSFIETHKANQVQNATYLSAAETSMNFCEQQYPPTRSTPQQQVSVGKNYREGQFLEVSHSSVLDAGNSPATMTASKSIFNSPRSAVHERSMHPSSITLDNHTAQNEQVNVAEQPAVSGVGHILAQENYLSSLLQLDGPIVAAHKLIHSNIKPAASTLQSNPPGENEDESVSIFFIYCFNLIISHSCSVYNYKCH